MSQYETPLMSQKTSDPDGGSSSALQRWMPIDNRLIVEETEHEVVHGGLFDDPRGENYVDEDVHMGDMDGGQAAGTHGAAEG